MLLVVIGYNMYLPIRSRKTKKNGRRKTETKNFPHDTPKHTYVGTHMMESLLF